MDIEQLRSMGLVHSNPLLRREINVRYRPLIPREQWADPKVEERQEEAVDGTVTVWLRKLTAADQVAIAAAMGAKRDYVYTLLHRSVYNEKGLRVFETEEIAAEVDLAMFAGLIDEINKINETAPKKAQPRKSYGASLRSASADDPLPNGKTPLPQKSLTPGSDTVESMGH
jgi:hypothetical protein